MQYPSLSKNHTCLNRLALNTGRHEAVDPYQVINHFFDAGSITEMKKLFTAACTAALSQQYSWQRGCPGNLLYFYEQLELLVEACYLISINKKYNRKYLKKIQHQFKKRSLQKIQLPTLLSATECSNPFLVMQSFFELHSIKKWKQWLYAWMEAGLSDYDVLQSIGTQSILPYHLHVQKLMDACWCINAALEKKKT